MISHLTLFSTKTYWKAGVLAGCLLLTAGSASAAALYMNFSGTLTQLDSQLSPGSGFVDALPSNRYINGSVSIDRLQDGVQTQFGIFASPWTAAVTPLFSAGPFTFVRGDVATSATLGPVAPSRGLDSFGMLSIQARLDPVTGSPAAMDSLTTYNQYDSFGSRSSAFMMSLAGDFLPAALIQQAELNGSATRLYTTMADMGFTFDGLDLAVSGFANFHYGETPLGGVGSPASGAGNTTPGSTYGDGIAGIIGYRGSIAIDRVTFSVTPQTLAPVSGNVPAPAGLVLILAGLGAYGAVARRKA